MYDEFEEFEDLGMYDDSFEDMLEEAIAYMKDKEETLLKKWLNKIGYTKPVGYYYDRRNKVVEIYSTRPGLLIGKGGVNIEEFKKMLSKEFYGEWKVKCIQIRGGFVNINE